MWHDSDKKLILLLTLIFKTLLFPASPGADFRWTEIIPSLCVSSLWSCSIVDLAPCLCHCLIQICTFSALKGVKYSKAGCWQEFAFFSSICFSFSLCTHTHTQIFTVWGCHRTSQQGGCRMDETSSEPCQTGCFVLALKEGVHLGFHCATHCFHPLSPPHVRLCHVSFRSDSLGSDVSQAALIVVISDNSIITALQLLHIGSWSPLRPRSVLFSQLGRMSSQGKMFILYF